MNENNTDLFENTKFDTETFNSNSFLNKVSKVFKTAGKGIIEKILLLYVMEMDPAIPKNVKLVILSGLTYFLLPFDAIPDFLVGIGYSDDLSVALGILYLFSTHITKEHKEKAKEMTKKLFKE
ncbi:MAG: YkvA family protein [Candidatus Kapaibacteriota bacterium]|jgi:uncharacterized membrane protein YkvA (DUF1232 family)